MGRSRGLSKEQRRALDRLRAIPGIERLVAYPYSPAAPLLPGPSGFKMASLLDLGVMKVAAISRRGIRRDFWDLHTIVHAGVPLGEIVAAYATSVGASASNLYHVLRSLTWFEDAERDEEALAGLTPKRWREIKRFFDAEVPGLL